jgi:hypothetical protein
MRTGKVRSAMLAGVQYGIPVAQIYRAGNNPLLDRKIARFLQVD